MPGGHHVSDGSSIPRISSLTIGEAWVDVARLILQSGHASVYDGLAIREVIMATLIISEPTSKDATIER